MTVLKSEGHPVPTPYSLNSGVGNSSSLPDCESGQKHHASSSSHTSEAYHHSRRSHILLLIACLSWMAVSSGAIMINRSVMVDLGFRYPVTVACIGLATSTALASAWVLLMIPKHKQQHVSRHDYFTRVAPVGFFMAVTFQCGNTGYLYLTVAFVQMLKALCPVVTMVLLFVAKLEVATRRLVASVVVISLGIALASIGEMNMSVVGLIAMLTSVVSESVRLVMTQHLLVGRSFSPMEGLMYIGSACTMWLLLQALFWELKPILLNKAGLIILAHPGTFVLAASAGFGVNALAILVIKLSSSLTLKVLGSVKDTLLVGVGMVFLHEVVSWMQLIGYSISLCGFISYNLIKSQRPLAGGPQASGKGAVYPPVKLVQLRMGDSSKESSV